MTLGIMQPYFLPYIGYFSLIKHCDEFILFDTPQYIRHGWIERNRIIKRDGDPFYIKVPLNKTSQKATIDSITINNNSDWQAKILAQLVHYKKKAPHYDKVVALLKAIFETPVSSITELNFNALSVICDYLNIKTPIKIWSKMDLIIDEVKSPDEWALNICKARGANSYFNPPGGRTFFNGQKYNDAGISLKFMKIEATKYTQFSNEFVPFLSIIDVLMFCSIDQIDTMLNQVNFTE